MSTQEFVRFIIIIFATISVGTAAWAAVAFYLLMVYLVQMVASLVM